MTKRSVRSLCSKIVSKDPNYKTVEVRTEHLADEDLLRVFRAMKTMGDKKTFKIKHYWNLTYSRALLLASALMESSNVNELSFVAVHNVEEFSAIVLAVRQVASVTRLQFCACTISATIFRGIQELLLTNAIESLAIIDCHRTEPPLDPHDLSNALQRCRSLKELVILAAVRREMFAHTATIESIPTLLFNAKHKFETLNLLGVSGISSPMVALIARVAASKSLTTFAIQSNDIKGYAVEAVVDMMENSAALLELALPNCNMGPMLAKKITRALQCDGSSSLEQLDLCGNSLGDQGANDIAGLLSTNTSIKGLFLDNNNIGNAGAVSLGKALKRNSSVETLHLCFNNIAHDGTVALADALSLNNTVREFDMQQVGAGADDAAICMAQMLEVNETIEDFTLGGFGQRGLHEFIRCLRNMQSVKNLLLMAAQDSLTLAMATDCVNALQDNTVIQSIEFNGCETDEVIGSEVLSQLEYLLDLNCGGRRILNASNGPPRALWPCILGRECCSKDAIFHFLRERPEIVDRATIVKKRKRDD